MWFSMSELKWSGLNGNSVSLLNIAREYSNQLNFGSKGWKGVFEYKFNRIEKSPAESMWLILFYDFATFWGITDKEKNN